MTVSSLVDVASTGVELSPTARARQAAVATVVVLGVADGVRLRRCLEALGEQEGVGKVDVVVVERPSEQSAELARCHHLVDRVVLATHDAPGALAGRGLWSMRSGIVAVLEASSEPDPGWLRRGLDAFSTGAEAVWSPIGAADGVLLDMTAVWRAWWHDGVVRLPPDDTPAGLRRWVGGAGLWCVDVSRLPAAIHLAPVATLEELPVAEPRRLPGLVSVVVCSHQRPEALARCLRSLKALQDPDHEIIVVDNGHEPQYDRTLIESFGARYVHEPRRGLDHARNRGYRESRGAVIAYIDDDCEADPHWLTGVRVAMADGDVGLVAGRVLPASLARPTERWFEAWFGFDRGMAPDRCARDDPRRWAPLYPSLLGTGANMAYRREVLDAIGGFDELLDVGSAVGGGGDIDAFARVLDLGSVGAYEPSAVVVHHHRTDMRALRKQFFGYGQALGAVCFKYAVGRPGRKREALRFYRERLRDQRRRLRSRRSQLPRTLTLVEIAGQLHGPLAYLLAGLRSRGRS